MLRQSDAGWSNPRVLGILALVFVCGLVCGAAATRTFMHARMDSGSYYQSMERARGIGLERLKDQLQLSPAQLQIVTKELDDYAKYYQNIEDQREDVAELGTRRIVSVLTPEQKERFFKLLGIRRSASENPAPVSSAR